MNPSNNNNENENKASGSGFPPSSSHRSGLNHQEEESGAVSPPSPPERPPCMTLIRAAQLRASMSPPTSPSDDSNSPAQLREYQTAMTAISLTELTSYGLFRDAGAGRDPMVPRQPRRPLTRQQLQGTIQMVLDLVSEDDF